MLSIYFVVYFIVACLLLTRKRSRFRRRIAQSTLQIQQAQPPEQQIFVASCFKGKYHHLYCEWAARISRKNEMLFLSREQARDIDFRPCYVCRPDHFWTGCENMSFRAAEPSIRKGWVKYSAESMLATKVLFLKAESYVAGGGTAARSLSLLAWSILYVLKLRLNFQIQIFESSHPRSDSSGVRIYVRNISPIADDSVPQQHSKRFLSLLCIQMIFHLCSYRDRPWRASTNARKSRKTEPVYGADSEL